MAISRALMVLAGTMMCAFGVSGAQQAVSLEQRPLTLPKLNARDPCPASVGRKDAVPPQSHIFGIGSFWFGDSPVLLSLAWKDPADADRRAVFSLGPVPRERDAYRAKTPWVSAPSYAGPVLIRGRALRDDEKPLEFDVFGTGRRSAVRLTAPNAPQPNFWSFWASSMWIPGPGCYGVQIDTVSATEVVIFEAYLAPLR
jgi:hypothetical protein